MGVARNPDAVPLAPPPRFLADPWAWMTLLAVLPIGVIVFPGSGISANLADKAKKLGIPVWKSGGAP